MRTGAQAPSWPATVTEVPAFALDLSEGGSMLKPYFGSLKFTSVNLRSQTRAPYSSSLLQACQLSDFIADRELLFPAKDGVHFPCKVVNPRGRLHSELPVIDARP